MPSWDSVQYLRFAEARIRPAHDLLSRIPTDAPECVVDVGCGPGNSTRLLVERWPAARVIGLDSSRSMLARAGEGVPDATFIAADLAEWQPPQPVDVVFANATLQWLDDHPAIMGHLLGWLAPGGVLALQMPDNFDQPSHVLMRQIAGSQRWAGRLDGVLRDRPVLETESYHRLLAAAGRRVDIWTTEYLHVVEGSDPVLEWMRGTGLRPVTDRLDRGEAEEFVAAYAEALRNAYPPEPDGSTLFPFRRLFIVVSG